MTSVVIAGNDLYYEESGVGPPILFIHGLLTDADTWKQQVACLSSDFRCVTYDRWGSSRSQLGNTNPPAPHLHAEHAADFISSLGLRPCLVVASSMGGVVAIELLHRFPELVRGAVLSEPAIFSLAPVEGPALVRKVSADVQGALDAFGLRAAVEVFSQSMDGEAWLMATNEERDRIAANVPILLRVLQKHDEYRIEPEELYRIEVPCLVIQGDRSPPAFPQVARRLAELLPNSRLVTLEDSGHLTYLHQPSRFSSLVREFASNLA